MTEEIQTLKARFLEIENIFEEGNEDHQLIYDLEEKIQEVFHQVFKEEDEKQINKLDKLVKEFKQENDFYDAEGELDSMFPDRHDEDFDDDSMSYDSVFGDE
ncbi:hypothetical protein [Zobellia alginiliquefaciens]|uniref:hypothetical protein n=1 Tax=Zobellia alginiliquefaciens TaxID=3032586 RepID=UPI0023E3CB96|nr:hypothetical protein [Zobellia alginiliquefaciens]